MAKASPTRRARLPTIITIVGLVATAVLTGCGSTTLAPDGTASGPATSGPSSGPTSGDVAPGTLVMIIRHGEKPDGSTQGVDAAGNEDDSSLTEVGWDRAHRLVGLFAPAQGPTQPGLDRPTAIYAAGANDNGYGQRTRETVAPLADRLDIPVNTTFGKGDEEDLVEHVLTQPGPTLISWQHSEIPSIAEAFPSVQPTAPAEWPDDRFDVIWTLTKTPDGWQFAQLPELVLPQDQASVVDDD